METQSEADKLKRTIAMLEEQRHLLSDAVVEAALAPLREKLASLVTSPLGEQRKLVTVLFADLAGFTDLSSQMDPEDVREIMNAYFGRWSVCIQRHEGVVEKYIGDAVMAVFGLPAGHEDDPERAIRAALDMQKELKQLNDLIERERGLRLSMRVGINTGVVVLSLLGERGGEEFVVVGDTVNLASRLQAAAPADGILITQDTYRHVRGLFEASPFGPLELRGVSHPVQAYWIKAAKPLSFRLGERGVEGVETSLVGRQSELIQLKEAFHQAIKANERLVITLVGEAGIGKSRLLYEFEAWLDLLPEKVFYFRGRAHPSSQHAAYSLVRDVFAFRCQIQDSDPPSLVREKLEKTISQALGEEKLGQMKAHWIARLLGFEIGPSEHLRGAEDDAKGLHVRALVYLGDYFRAVGGIGPAVIMLEDIHWADNSSLDLIYRLDSALAAKPFLIVATARPSLFERRPHWGDDLASHTRIDLGPLSMSESQSMVAEILKKVDTLPVALQELVVKTAEGNPFFIEELIKMLIEDGVIMMGEPAWTVEEWRLGDLRVPPTLMGVLQARFDILEAEQRATLQRGAVFGRVFWDQAVEWLRVSEASREESSLQDATEIFEDLRQREMVFRRDQSTFEDTVEYLFKHALLRDVTYSSLLKRQRRFYHGLAARWLEEVTTLTQRSGEFSLLIAEHYDEAGEPGPAADWYLRAGRAAAARFANTEALSALSRALELAPVSDPRLRFTVLLEREKVYELLGKREEQLLDLDAHQKAADESGDLSCIATAALRRARYAFQTADYSTALEYVLKTEELAENVQNPELAAQSSILQASILMRQGELDLAESRAQRALTLAAQQSLVGIEAEGYRQLGLIAYYEGKHRLAGDHFARSLQLYEQAGNRQGEGMALNNLGGATFESGEYEQAGRYYFRSLQLCQEIGDRIGEGRALNNLGIVAVTQGAYAQAEEYYLQSLQICRDVGYRSFEISALDNLGNLAMYRYDYSQAERYQLEALAGAREIGDRVNEAINLINLSQLYLAVGEYENALSYIQESLELNRHLGDRQGSCQVRTNLSQYMTAVGELNTALEYCEQALALAGELDLPHEQVSVLQIQGSILQRLGNFGEAIERFRKAQEIQQELEDTTDWMVTLAGLGSAHLALGDLPQALECVEMILDKIANHAFNGLDRPAGVFLSCYTVLSAAQSPRAMEILCQGYELMQEVASKIEDEVMRRSYLERVPENRALAETWSEASRSFAELGTTIPCEQGGSYPVVNQAES